MSGGLRGQLRRGVVWLEPPPRVVDWSIFGAVLFLAGTGILSFLGHTPEWIVLFWAHRLVGLSLIPLLAFKLARVRTRLTDPGNWQLSTPLSILTGVAALVVIATGALWVFGVEPDLGPVTMLSVHAGLGLLLVLLMVLHARTRFRPPSTPEFARRRTAMQYGAMLVAAALVYRGQTLLNEVFDAAGADRRLTGSHRREGSGNDSFPVVSWVADDPDPVAVDEWALAVGGTVEESLALPYGTLTPDTVAEATLDCTGGWYTVQEWGGVRVGELLDKAGATGDARYVRFESVTGYRWSLPIEEARGVLLATHVGGERLSHGHGAPLRLVAPGRRGFQWVKWVERVEVRRRGDPAQWLATLVSGL
ncbi:sulfite oxidase [Halobacteriales archaeon QS_4_66_20]|nr:MAG: sulfite oxidase [Halobacteriales archaeon QS_4_66_20]